MRKQHKIMLMWVLLVVFMSTSCGSMLKNVNMNNIDTNLILVNCVKTWKVIDYTADTTFSVLGEMHTDGKLTDEQIKPIIAEGEKLRADLTTTKDEIMAYLWEKELGMDNNTRITRALSLVEIVSNTIKSYYQLKLVASTVYEQSTGAKLYMPDVPLVEIK